MTWPLHQMTWHDMTCHVATNHSSSPHVASQPTTLLHLTPQATSWHQNRSHYHRGTAESSFTAKKWFGHGAGRSPCAHSIGKFFLCYIVLFSSETSAPGSPGNYLYTWHDVTYLWYVFQRFLHSMTLQGQCIGIDNSCCWKSVPFTSLWAPQGGPSRDFSNVPEYLFWGSAVFFDVLQAWRYWAGRVSLLVFVLFLFPGFHYSHFTCASLEWLERQSLSCFRCCWA